MNDPIADMLTRIRNAQAVRKSSVQVPHSKLKANLAEMLHQLGYIGTIETTGEGVAKNLSIELRYESDGAGVIKSVQRISKPGRRVYSKKKDLPYVLNGFGVAIVSTPRGLMTNKQARKENLGGEVLCEIY